MIDGIQSKPKAVMVAPGVSQGRLKDIEAALWYEHDRAELIRAGKQVGRVWEEAAAKPVQMDAAPGEIRALAERRASLMMDRLVVGHAIGDLKAFHRWINAEVQAMQGRELRLKPGTKPEEQRKGLISRATCRNWWAKSLKKAASSLREAMGREKAHVCARRQQYITDETMRRQINDDAANKVMMENTEIESEDGEVISLALASSKSNSNPLIKRGELMTRIKGCDHWGEHHGLVGLFTTQTAPSRFHAVHLNGVVNEKWIAAGKPTPKDGQRWLCNAWKHARAELNRRGLRIFGFRVAEPHHDGTPHWHGLFWCRPEDAEPVEAVIRKHWLKDAGDEAGAQKYRFHVKLLEKGGATAYIAKYITKGVDDEGAVGYEGHDDEIEGRMVRMEQQDMFGGGAARVATWARTHGIRQFQPIGQVPVTVWRELRRVPEAALAEASPRVRSAHEAVQRVGEKRADWAKYMLYQGGPFVGRDYRIGMDTELREVMGRYEVSDKHVPLGVVDRIEGAKAASSRKEWRPRGAWGARVNSCTTMNGYEGAKPAPSTAVHPWTRVNNCTARHHETIAGVPVWQVKKQAGRLLTWAEVIRLDNADHFNHRE